MFEQDYLMRLLMQFMEAMRRSIERADDGRDPAAAADMLENAIGDATDLDGSMLLSLAPESMASVLQVSGVDPHVTEYVANGNSSNPSSCAVRGTTNLQRFARVERGRSP